jgi:eukaryotic-like serine/threonine-protein kinase
MPPISPDRWRVLSPLLDEALDLATGQRSEWLASVAANDPSLAADLRTMLDEHEAMHEARFLDGSVLDPRLAATPALAGHVLGSYRLVSLIGQGGSGSVWLAERCDGRFTGRAAVKLLNPGLIARFGEERFRREGSILARLRDSRIAHLIDAGVTPGGQPYLVLEHVDGQPIDRYCDEHALPVESRLRLFLDVLEAVAHAHATLIVHRDIKPANVLVRTDGQVKLLDFGIAKLVEGRTDPDRTRTSENSAVTREVGRALTPEYAAPEQLSGEPVTTATDVYALGVLLYVLLTGRHPAGEDVQSPATLVRAILIQEPARMSDAAGGRGEPDERFARHAARCGTTPQRLRRRLRGDLDAIVARALSKNPHGRYASVTALADDIRRVLVHEPVSARPGTVGYRSARFVRRHVRSVVLTSAVLLLLAGLTAVYTARLSAERDRAQREAAKAVTVSQMLMGLLTSADPYVRREQPGEPTVRALLDTGTERVQKELAGQPDLQSEMLTIMGRTYRRLGVYHKAQELLEQALAAAHQAFGPEHPQVAQTLHDLGVAFADRGTYRSAAHNLERALAMRRTLLGPTDPEVAVTLAELGRVYQDEGQNSRAEPLHREALTIRRTVLGEEHRETAVSLSDLASVLRLNGDLAGAETLLVRCLELNRKTRGEEHPNTATTLHDLALIAMTRGEHQGAETVLRRVLAMQRASLGPTHPVVATTLNNLAHVLATIGRVDEAGQALEEALDILRPSLGSDSQLVAIYTINRAALHVAQRQPREAEILLREGLRIRTQAADVLPSRRRTIAEDDWSVGAIRSVLGATLVALGKYPEAETVLLQARQDLETAPVRRPEDIRATLSRLVELYAAWGKADAAATYRALLAS